LKENDGERKINMTNTKQLLPDNINQWLTENYGWLDNIEVEGDMFEIVQRIIAEALDMMTLVLRRKPIGFSRGSVTNDTLEWDEEYIKSLQEYIKSLQEEKLQTK